MTDRVPVPDGPPDASTWKQKAWDALAELADAKAEIARLQALIDGGGRVCSICGGPWGLTRPLCDIKGGCEGGYIMTKQAFDAIAMALLEVSP